MSTLPPSTQWQWLKILSDRYEEPTPYQTEAGIVSVGLHGLVRVPGSHRFAIPCKGSVLASVSEILSAPATSLMVVERKALSRFAPEAHWEWLRRSCPECGQRGRPFIHINCKCECSWHATPVEVGRIMWASEDLAVDRVLMARYAFTFGTPVAMCRMEYRGVPCVRMESGGIVSVLVGLSDAARTRGKPVLRGKEEQSGS